MNKEEKYVVVRVKDLKEASHPKNPNLMKNELKSWLMQNEIPTVECLVIEEKWTEEYQKVWEMIEKRNQSKE